LLLRPGCRPRGYGSAWNRCSDPGARAAAGSLPAQCTFGSMHLRRSKSAESTTPAHSTSDTASSRLLLDLTHLLRGTGRPENRRSDSAARAAADPVSPRCTFGSVWSSRSKSMESARSARSTSGAARSRLLLRPKYTSHDSDHARNRRSDPGARAVAGSLPLARRQAGAWWEAARRRVVKATTWGPPLEVQPRAAPLRVRGESD
jgi:hypothetical protein